MGCVRFGDGELCDFISCESTITTDGIPCLAFHFMPDDRITRRFIKDKHQINQEYGTVKKIIETVFITPMNKEQTIFFCVLDFNHDRTKISAKHESTHMMLLSQYREVDRIKQETIKIEESIKKLGAQSHSKIREIVKERKTSGSLRSQINDDYWTQKQD